MHLKDVKLFLNLNQSHFEKLFWIYFGEREIPNKLDVSCIMNWLAEVIFTRKRRRKTSKKKKYKHDRHVSFLLSLLCEWTL